MSRMTHKLGPMLFQFPFCNRKSPVRQREFIDRLRAFLPKLPAELLFVLEIGNKDWVGPELLDLPRKHKVAFAMIDRPSLPRPPELMRSGDIVTFDFAYFRMLGGSLRHRATNQDLGQVSRRSQPEVDVVGRNRQPTAGERGEGLHLREPSLRGHSPETLRHFLEMSRRRQEQRTPNSQHPSEPFLSGSSNFAAILLSTDRRRAAAVPRGPIRGSRIREQSRRWSGVENRKRE
jgi:uncharacterized protein YecE (DUF72 family)